MTADAPRGRTARIERVTSESSVLVELDLDGTGVSTIDTTVPFFDHMLDQLGKHSGCDLYVRTHGDLHIDEHHTVEDTAIAIGAAYNEALGDKRGVNRYGFLLPMDDALAQAQQLGYAEADPTADIEGFDAAAKAAITVQAAHGDADQLDALAHPVGQVPPPAG